jgi:hypothetical protein
MGFLHIVGKNPNRNYQTQLALTDPIRVFDICPTDVRNADGSVVR